MTNSVPIEQIENRKSSKKQEADNPKQYVERKFSDNERLDVIPNNWANYKPIDDG